MNNFNINTLHGLIFGISATLFWGSYPLWYKPLQNINAWELLSWRILFSEIFLIFFLIVTSRYKNIISVLNLRTLKHIVFMSLILGYWWYIYIYGILNNRVLEISVGYFISPLISMLISKLFFMEKTTFSQNIAISFATVGVSLMILRDLNNLCIPWIALSIGCCFSFYGIFKKQVSGDPLITQTFEIMFITPFAILFLFWQSLNEQIYSYDQSFKTNLLLIATGIITILPLWWYSLAAKVLSIKTLGFLQFIPPTCNFLLGILIYKESFDIYLLTTFVLIWIGIVIYVIDSIHKSRNKNI